MATGSGSKDIQNPPPRPPTLDPPVCVIHREWMEVEIRWGRNAMMIYQDRWDHQGGAPTRITASNDSAGLCGCVNLTKFHRVEQLLPGEAKRLKSSMGKER